MKYETKFKYNDKVQVITNKEMVGELINVVPKYLQDGVPVYTYIMHTIQGFKEVRDIDIQPISDDDYENIIYGETKYV